MFSAVDLIFFHISSYAMYKLDVCANRCKRIGYQKEDPQQQTMTLLKCVKEHVEIFQYVQTADEVREMISDSFFLF